MELFIFLFILIGLISGLFGGLLGIGGGVITVPALYYIFQYTHIVESSIMQIAICTALASSFITALMSTLAQMKKRSILFGALKYLIPGTTIGCIAGAIWGHHLKSETLGIVFASLASVFGFYFLFPKLPKLYIADKLKGSLAWISIVIGFLSSLLGIGGGSITFPILLAYQVPVALASGTSSASTALTTLIGTISYLSLSWNVSQQPYTIGYIQLPAFLGIALGSIFSSIAGVKLLHTLNVVLVKRIFGGCLILVGLSMYFL